jgi:hypothetical protein
VNLASIFVWSSVAFIHIPPRGRWGLIPPAIPLKGSYHGLPTEEIRMTPDELQRLCTEEDGEVGLKYCLIPKDVWESYLKLAGVPEDRWPGYLKTLSGEK